MNIPIVCRGYRTTDEAFLYRSWLESFKDSHYAGHSPAHKYFELYRDIIRQVLVREHVKILMAVNPDEKRPGNEIYGFLVTEGSAPIPVVHYCYVKETFRLLGVARFLWKSAGIDPKAPFFFTFATVASARIMKARGLSGKYKPKLVRQGQVEKLCS